MPANVAQGFDAAFQAVQKLVYILRGVFAAKAHTQCGINGKGAAAHKCLFADIAHLVADDNTCKVCAVIECCLVDRLYIGVNNDALQCCM